MRKTSEAFTKDFGLVQPSELGKIGQAFFLVQGYGEAKRGLLARDKYTAEQVEAMPEFQVIRLYAYLEYRDSLDEMLKWVHAPNGLRHPGFQKSADKYQAALTRLDRMFFAGALGRSSASAIPLARPIARSTTPSAARIGVSPPWSASKRCGCTRLRTGNGRPRWPT